MSETRWLHFRENIFMLGPNSVSSFSCNAQQQTYLLKLASAIFSEIFIFHQMIGLQKLWKRFLFHLKSSFRSGDIQIFVFFLPVSHFLKAWSKINLKVYDVFNCLKKNFVWYLEKKKKYDIETLAIDTVLNKEHFYGKIIQKMCT